MMPKAIATIIILSMILIILATRAAASQASVNVNAPERPDSDFIVVIGIENTVDLDTYGEGIPAIWFGSDVAIGVPVTVNPPDVASVVSGTFDVTIDIEDVLNMNTGQFDLSFDSSVVNVTDVENGLVNDKTMRIDEWKFVDSDTIRAIPKRPGDYPVSGSGHLATINFVMTGSGTSILDISDGKLAGILTEGTTAAEEIPATWTGDEVSM